jgi:hypothetical protein
MSSTPKKAQVKMEAKAGAVRKSTSQRQNRMILGSLRLFSIAILLRKVSFFDVFYFNLPFRT